LIFVIGSIGEMVVDLAEKPRILAYSQAD
jgi:hypothetical protein